MEVKKMEVKKRETGKRWYKGWWAALLPALVLAWAAPNVQAEAPPWSRYQLAPGADRTFLPVRANRSNFPIVLEGPAGTAVLFDFGQEVGGVTHITFERSNAASGSDAISVSLAYSESSLYVVQETHLVAIA